MTMRESETDRREAFPQPIRFNITLVCGHSFNIVSPPAVGERLWCFRCADYQRVDKAPPQYRTRCANCKQCRSRSVYGAARIRAEVQLAKHRQKHPTHTVYLYDGLRRVLAWGPLSDAQLHLVFDEEQDDAQPPF